MELVVVEVQINGLPFTIQMDEKEARERGLVKEQPEAAPKKVSKK